VGCYDCGPQGKVQLEVLDESLKRVRTEGVLIGDGEVYMEMERAVVVFQTCT
jgi:DNA-directed RNA polymerase subunit E'/Rpb7